MSAPSPSRKHSLDPSDTGDPALAGPPSKAPTLSPGPSSSSSPRVGRSPAPRSLRLRSLSADRRSPSRARSPQPARSVSASRAFDFVDDDDDGADLGSVPPAAASAASPPPAPNAPAVPPAPAPAPAPGVPVVPVAVNPQTPLGPAAEVPAASPAAAAPSSPVGPFDPAIVPPLAQVRASLVQESVRPTLSSSAQLDLLHFALAHVGALADKPEALDLDDRRALSSVIHGMSSLVTRWRASAAAPPSLPSRPAAPPPTAPSPTGPRTWAHVAAVSPAHAGAPAAPAARAPAPSGAPKKVTPRQALAAVYARVPLPEDPNPTIETATKWLGSCKKALADSQSAAGRLPADPTRLVNASFRDKVANMTDVYLADLPTGQFDLLRKMLSVVLKVSASDFHRFISLGPNSTVTHVVCTKAAAAAIQANRATLPFRVLDSIAVPKAPAAEPAPAPDAAGFQAAPATRRQSDRASSAAYLAFNRLTREIARTRDLALGTHFQLLLLAAGWSSASIREAALQAHRARLLSRAQPDVPAPAAKKPAPPSAPRSRAGSVHSPRHVPTLPTIASQESLCTVASMPDPTPSPAPSPASALAPNQTPTHV